MTAQEQVLTKISSKWIEAGIFKGDRDMSRIGNEANLILELAAARAELNREDYQVANAAKTDIDNRQWQQGFSTGVLYYKWLLHRIINEQENR